MDRASQLLSTLDKTNQVQTIKQKLRCEECGSDYDLTQCIVHGKVFCYECQCAEIKRDSRGVGIVSKFKVRCIEETCEFRRLSFGKL